MNKIVLNIKDETDLYERYSGNLSRELINYLIKKSKYIKGDIKIIVNTELKIQNLDKIIKEGLNDSLRILKKIDDSHNTKQILLFLIGILSLIVATIFHDDVIKEIIVIAGWFFIWEVVNISLNIDNELKLNRKLIKRILNSEIIINKIGD